MVIVNSLFESERTELRNFLSSQYLSLGVVGISVWLQIVEVLWYNGSLT